jgi:general secretion pathway protein I
MMRVSRTGRFAVQRGFSLLEVLVAFSIMALVLGTLFEIAGTSTRNSAHLQRHTYATLIGESLLGLYSSVPTGGLREHGESSDGFRWRIVSEPLAPSERSAPQQPAPMAVFHLVRIAVEWDDRGKTHEIVLVTALPQQVDQLPR